jgi:hypothetical protein
MPDRKCAPWNIMRASALSAVEFGDVGKGVFRPNASPMLRLVPNDGAQNGPGTAQVAGASHLRSRSAFMEVGYLLPILALFTLLAVCIAGLVSKRSTDNRREKLERGEAPKSTLSQDAPNEARGEAAPLDDPQGRRDARA